MPFPSAEDLPDPGIKLGSPALQADPLPTELWEKPFFILEGHIILKFVIGHLTLHS